MDWLRIVVGISYFVLCTWIVQGAPARAKDDALRAVFSANVVHGSVVNNEHNASSAINGSVNAQVITHNSCSLEQLFQRIGEVLSKMVVNAGGSIIPSIHDDAGRNRVEFNVSVTADQHNNASPHRGTSSGKQREASWKKNYSTSSDTNSAEMNFRGQKLFPESQDPRTSSDLPEECLNPEQLPELDEAQVDEDEPQADEDEAQADEDEAQEGENEAQADDEAQADEVLDSVEQDRTQFHSDFADSAELDLDSEGQSTDDRERSPESEDQALDEEGSYQNNLESEPPLTPMMPYSDLPHIHNGDNYAELVNDNIATHNPNSVGYNHTRSDELTELLGQGLEHFDHQYFDTIPETYSDVPKALERQYGRTIEMESPTNQMPQYLTLFDTTVPSPETQYDVPQSSKRQYGRTIDMESPAVIERNQMPQYRTSDVTIASPESQFDIPQSSKRQHGRTIEMESPAVIERNQVPLYRISEDTLSRRHWRDLFADAGQDGVGVESQTVHQTLDDITLVGSHTDESKMFLPGHSHPRAFTSSGPRGQTVPSDSILIPADFHDTFKQDLTDTVNDIGSNYNGDVGASSAFFNIQEEDPYFPKVRDTRYIGYEKASETSAAPIQDIAPAHRLPLEGEHPPSLSATPIEIPTGSPETSNKFGPSSELISSVASPTISSRSQMDTFLNGCLDRDFDVPDTDPSRLKNIDVLRAILFREFLQQLRNSCDSDIENGGVIGKS